MNRRGFIRGIATFAATLALAPRLAFRAPDLKYAPPLPNWEQVPFWTETSLLSRCMDDGYRRWLEQLMSEHKR